MTSKFSLLTICIIDFVNTGINGFCLIRWMPVEPSQIGRKSAKVKRVDERYDSTGTVGNI